MSAETAMRSFAISPQGVDNRSSTIRAIRGPGGGGSQALAVPALTGAPRQIFASAN